MFTVILLLIAGTCFVGLTFYAEEKNWNRTSDLALGLALILTVGSAISFLWVIGDRVDKMTTQCQAVTRYKKGEKVYLKELDKPFVILSSDCKLANGEVLVAKYKVISETGIEAEVTEDLLEKR